MEDECARLAHDHALFNDAYEGLQEVFDFRDNLLTHTGHLIPVADQTSRYQSDAMSNVSDVEGEIDHITDAYLDSFGNVNEDLLYQEPTTLLMCVNRYFSKSYLPSKLHSECVQSGLFKVSK